MVTQDEWSMDEWMNNGWMMDRQTDRQIPLGFPLQAFKIALFLWTSVRQKPVKRKYMQLIIIENYDCIKEIFLFKIIKKYAP